MQPCNFWSVNKKFYRFCFLRWKSCTFARFKIWQCTGKCFHICWSVCCSRSNTLLCPEGSFLVPEIGILFGDAVGASLVRGPWLPPRGCYVICDVAVCSWCEQHDSREYLRGASNKPPGRHQIQNAEGPVLVPCAKQIYFRRDPKVDPLRIESGPSWQACFWSLHFVRCASFASCYVRKISSLKLLSHKQHPRRESWTVRGPWLPPRGCYVICDVAVCSWCEQHDSREYLRGASNKPPGRHQIQNAEGPVLVPCAKQIYFRRDPKVDPLRIESGPSWQACFWSLHFVRCASFASCYVRKISSLKLLSHKQHPRRESWTGEARIYVSSFSCF